MAGRCPRKWGFKYISKLPIPTTPSQAIGLAVHKEFENFFTHGTKPQDPRVLKALENPELPTLNIGVLVEGSVKWRIREGVDFLGIIDLRDMRDPLKSRIIDHKTAGSTDYLKTEEELHEDIQMVAYAKYAIDQDPRIQYVEVAHNVILTKGAPKCLPLTKATLSREHIEEVWKNTHLPIIDRIEHFRTLPVEQMETTGKHNGECRAFGGCPFADPCATMEIRKMILPPDAAEAKKEVPMALSKEEQRAQIQAALAAKKAGAAPAAPTSASAPAVEPTTPPPATTPAKSPAERLAAIEAMRAKKAAETAPAATPPAPAPSTPTPTPAPTEEPKRRTRAKIQDAPATPVPTSAAPAPAPTPSPVPAEVAQTPVAAPTMAQARIALLCINAIPLSGGVAVETWAAPALERINAGLKINNWLFAPYNEGKAAVLLALQNAESYPMCLVVDTRTPLGQIAAEALTPLAAMVVRGTS